MKNYSIKDYKEVTIPKKNGYVVIGAHIHNKMVDSGTCFLIIWENGICVKHEHGLTWEEILEIGEIFNT